MNRDLLDEPIPAEEAFSHYYFQLGLKFFYSYCVCLIISMLLIFKSDGHPLINDEYAKLAIVFFCAFMFLSIISIVLTVLSIVKRETTSRTRTCVIIWNGIFMAIYLFYAVLIYIDLK